MKVWAFIEYVDGRICVFDSKEKAIAYYQALQRDKVDRLEEPLHEYDWEIKEWEMNPIYHSII